MSATDEAAGDVIDFVSKLVIIVALATALIHSTYLLWIAHVLRNVGAG
ncbi:hypothetical protein [Thalassovita aquimarina]|nr:hypothetical protein [Thalassovita aquimarina]